MKTLRILTVSDVQAYNTVLVTKSSCRTMDPQDVFILERFVPFDQRLPIPATPCLWQPPLYFVSVSSTPSDSACKWNPTVFVFLPLVYFT